MDLTVYTTGDWMAEPVPEPALSSTFLSFTVTIRNNGARVLGLVRKAVQLKMGCQPLGKNHGTGP